MAEKRRLQQDIEKTLRRVEEGLQLFADVHEKLYTATNGSQKEKLEAELKREIKKLQRFRDQIKGWQASSDVKDKLPLEDARRKIEKEMERFKVVERELKMKAFSNEGLAAPVKVDPQEEERSRHREWLCDAIAQLRNAVDQQEAALETMVHKHRVKGKRALEEESGRVDDLRSHVGRHMWHIDKMEQTLRRLDNDSLDMSLLDEVQYAFSYYIEAHQDPDFYFDETMYADLNLDHEENADPSGGGEEGSGSADGSRCSSPLSASHPSSSSSSSSSSSASSSSSYSSSEPSALDSPGLAAPRRTSGAASASKGQTEFSLPPPHLAEALAGRPSAQPNPFQAQAAKEDGTSLVGSFSASPSSSSAILPPSSSSAPSFSSKAAGGQGPALGLLGRHAKALDQAESLRNLQLAVECSHSFHPMASDRNRYRTANIPKTPWLNAPHSFPTQPLNQAESPSFFEKLEIGTLFFIFYYQPGTYTQYLAAKELKRQSWRFHKKYLTWFQRHTEPKATTDLYEQGAYIYFDYEAGWCSRIKPDFTFEYQWLEDEVIV
eukprot:GHVT01001421.1.p1 GENE.GHVT01001421.1~~GHVT01001421.1.p1  ORF type:complete len:612 (+),score=198.63 GHVT01001421.1:191-1837(+)